MGISPRARPTAGVLNRVRRSETLSKMMANSTKFRTGEWDDRLWEKLCSLFVTGRTALVGTVVLSGQFSKRLVLAWILGALAAGQGAEHHIEVAVSQHLGG